ncbi:hypothetical protein O6H91_02G139100 [Diphasiastrum complanatum]|nr:hypothetical protein O6H91_02G139100 [Diphasiastrum complanatum]
MKALELFEAMLGEGLIPHKFDVVSILKACANLAAFNKGRHVHEWIVASGLGSDVYIGNGLIDMYMKCGCTEEACRVFNEMLHRDIVSWSAMIMGYALCGEAEKALELFDKMRQENVKPNRVTFLGALKACSGIESLRDGRVVHEQILRSECGSDVIVGNCLISMYSKCCSIEDACRVFNSLSTEDVVSWSALILGYLKCGQGEKALQLFAQMHREQVQANRVTFTGVINACASIASLEDGRHAHAQVIKQALNSDTLVGNSLIDMYTKCGSLDGACRVFNNMQMRTVVSWNTMIMCFVRYGQANKVLQLYKQMQLESIETSTFTFVGVLNACANAGALEEGKLIHANIIRCRFHLDITVANCLIDMYSKCGSIEDACRMFNNMGKRDLVSWNSMLGGFSMSGLAKETLRLLGHIPRDGLEIDSTTVVCILSACSRAGFVDEGLHYFEVIGPLYGNLATVEHYSCMVDLLARSGHLHEAEYILERMPYQPDVSMWLSLLGACRIYGEVEIGEQAANHILVLEPSNASGYVLLSNIYAAARG